MTWKKINMIRSERGMMQQVHIYMHCRIVHHIMYRVRLVGSIRVHTHIISAPDIVLVLCMYNTLVQYVLLPAIM